MLKPNESLDDYVVKALPETIEPPRPVSLRLTGEVEVLKPLARWERPVKLVPAAPAPHRLSWFHRSLVMGGGFAVAALVFASAIVIGVSDSTSQPEMAQIEFIEAPNETDRTLPTEDPLSSDIFSVTEPTSAARPVPTRARKHRAYQSRNLRAAAPVRSLVQKKKALAEKEPHQSLVSKFVPTTLVIFIENGLIKSKIEPWLSDRK